MSLQNTTEEYKNMPTLRELRVRQDLSQSQLAVLAGVGEQTIWRAEAGRAIKREIARAICQALGTEPDQVEIGRASCRERV